MEFKGKLNNKITIIMMLAMISIEKSTSLPAFYPRQSESWKENPLDPVWLQEIPLRDEEILQNDYSFPLIQPERQGNEFDSWKEGSVVYGTEVRSPTVTRQTGNNRLVKKDSYVTRNWGADGLPFSVLYMNPHAARPNQPSESTKQSDIKRPMEVVTPKTPNNRPTSRNGANGQPRRQHSIIPQLFISYGWGPFGK